MALDYTSFQTYLPGVTVISETDFTNTWLPRALVEVGRVTAGLVGCDDTLAEYENAVFALVLYLYADQVTDASLSTGGSAGGTYLSQYKVNDEVFNYSQLSNEAAIQAQLAAAKDADDFFNMAMNHLKNAGCIIGSGFVGVTG